MTLFTYILIIGIFEFLILSVLGWFALRHGHKIQDSLEYKFE